MSTPSIALIPSGYKEGKLYSQLPTNGDGDLTFARTSIANRVNEQGVIEEMGVNVPRLDYSDGGCPSLLLEPQSTNLWVGSEGTDATYTTPLGDFGFTNINSFTYASNQNVVGKTVSMFFLVKKADNSTPIIGSSGNTSSDVVVYLSGSSGVSDDFTTTDLGSGFYLAELENYAVIGTNTNVVNIQNNSGVDTFISMVQLEELTYSTSYIETLNGTIETRTADTASKSGLSNYINSQEGVFYAELRFDKFFRIGLSNASKSNQIIIGSVSDIFCRVKEGGSVVFTDFGVVSNFTDYFKIAFKFKSGDSSFFIDGVKTNTNNSNFNLSDISDILFDIDSEDLYGKVKDLRVYNTALTDQELTDLTS